jgi:hypothetical protein
MNRRWKNPSTLSKGTYASWAAMNRRCYNSADKDFVNYGGRGITVCDRWRNDYDAFVEDMGFKPEKLTIERIETSGNYEPGNCHWATRVTQANNRRGNRLLAGSTVATQARRVGMTRQAMLYRADKGIPPDQVKRPDEAQHGTISRYTSQKHNCRCAECREAWRLYNFRKRK